MTDEQLTTEWLQKMGLFNSVNQDQKDTLAAFCSFVRALLSATEPAPNVAAYVTVLRNVAQANQVTLIAQYDYIASLPNWQAMLTDCLHPNDALYAIKAQREAAVLGPMVQALP